MSANIKTARQRMSAEALLDWDSEDFTPPIVIALEEEIADLRAALAEAEKNGRAQGGPENSTKSCVSPLGKGICGGPEGGPEHSARSKCWCHTCRPVTAFGHPEDNRMVLCPTCGNKRCPHANDHRNECTGSNEPGQKGSAYPATPSPAEQEKP